MTLTLVTLAGRAWLDKVGNKGSEVRPGIIAANEFQCFVLAEVARENMVVLELEDTKSKVISLRDVDCSVIYNISPIFLYFSLIFSKLFVYFSMPTFVFLSVFLLLGY